MTDIQEKLLNIYKKNPNTPTREAAVMGGCTVRYARMFKRWCADGTVVKILEHKKKERKIKNIAEIEADQFRAYIESKNKPEPVKCLKCNKVFQGIKKSPVCPNCVISNRRYDANNATGYSVGYY